MAKKGGLGRGIDSLFLDNSFDEVNKNAIEEISLSLIDPKSNQPRKYFDNEALSQLADSIAAHGVLQPIIVREIASGRYQIIAGERRWRASKLAGKTDIPCIIVDKDDLKAAQIALVENIQRENLNPLEEALAYRALAKEYEMTQEELSAQVGKNRSAIANSLRLLDLPEEVLELLDPISLNSLKELSGIVADEMDEETGDIVSGLFAGLVGFVNGYAILLGFLVALSALFLNKDWFITATSLSVVFFVIFVGAVWFVVFLGLCIAYSILASKVKNAYTVSNVAEQLAATAAPATEA